MLGIDAGDVIQLSVSPLELIVRGTLVYWFLYLLLRFVLRRDASSVGLTDILFIVLLGDAAQNAMIGDGKTVGDGLVLISVLAFWNFTLDFVAFRFPWTRRFLEPSRLTLFKDGKKFRKNMRRELITEEELNAEVRLQGLRGLDEVEAIFLEASGEISVVKKKS
jgi:uncharacterized membrane protein YcaP (DUF421 family)